MDTAYGPAMNVATKNMIGLDSAFQRYFSEDEVRQLLMTYFTKDIFKNVIEKSSSKFSQDISSAPLDSSKADKLKMTFDFSPFLEPSRLFLQSITQQILDRIPPCATGVEPDGTGVFPSCSLLSWQTSDFKQKFNKAFQVAYEQKVLKSIVGPNEAGFARDVTFDVSRRDAVFAIRQFEMMNMYTVFFVLAFVSLMLLLWMRNFHTGLMLSSLMLVTASVLGLLLALILSKVVSLFPPESIVDPTVSQSTLVLARDLLSVILMSFAKVYAIILGIVMLCSGAVYVYANRYLKKS